jgi:FMN phosphatase YigB (HAD superfamily)
MIVVFDIDGTLANCEHRLHHIKNKPKNWKKFFGEMVLDTPIKEMTKLHDHLHFFNDILYCTGRTETHRKQTEDWLMDNLGIEDPDEDMTASELLKSKLYMRRANDSRPDYITKVDLLNDIIKDHGKPDLWLDDRQGVVAAIRAQGIRVLQVAPNE